MFRIFFILLCIFGQVSGESTKLKMVKDLNVIEQTFDVMYAPKEWKKSYADWDLTEQIDRAKLDVLEKDEITTKDYQRIVRNFFASTRDYHVGVQFYSTEVSILPFSISGSNGRYFITSVIEKDWPQYMSSPLNVGDEILFFNSQPIDDVVQEFKRSEFRNHESLTDQALAEMEFTRRAGLNGHIVPQGPVFLTVRKAGTKNIVTSQMDWLYFPELLTGFGEEVTFFNDQRNILERRMTTPFYDNQIKISQIIKNSFEESESEDDYEPKTIGQRDSILPPLGKITWQSKPYSTFEAYIYRTSRKKSVGFVRIPTFDLGAYETDEFADIISHFAKNTDALIIDEMNNPGGSPFFMYALLSMLTDTPLLTTRERTMITSADISYALYNLFEIQDVASDADAREIFGYSINGYPVDMKLIQKISEHFGFIISEWNAGRTFTNLDHMYGIDYIEPHATVCYNKPIIVLVNSLAFSCADFFPALLQDNNRATIIGTTTAGAGGFVAGHEFPNLFGISSFNYTGSIAERINNNPIENLGITPDIWLEMTPRDLEYNYVEFIEELNKVVDNL